MFKTLGIHGARKYRRWRGLLVETFCGWVEDKVPRLGAALAYYTGLPPRTTFG